MSRALVGAYWYARALAWAIVDLLAYVGMSRTAPVASVRVRPVQPVAPSTIVPPLVRRWGAAVREVLDGELTVAVVCECCQMNDGLAADRFLFYVEATHQHGDRYPRLTEAA